MLQKCAKMDILHFCRVAINYSLLKIFLIYIIVYITNEILYLGYMNFILPVFSYHFCSIHSVNCILVYL